MISTIRPRKLSIGRTKGSLFDNIVVRGRVRISDDLQVAATARLAGRPFLPSCPFSIPHYFSILLPTLSATLPATLSATLVTLNAILSSLSLFSLSPVFLSPPLSLFTLPPFSLLLVLYRSTSSLSRHCFALLSIPTPFSELFYPLLSPPSPPLLPPPPPNASAIQRIPRHSHER